MPRAAWGLAVLLAMTGAAGLAFAQTAPLPPSGGPPRSHPDYDKPGLPPPEPATGSAKLPPILGAPVRPAGLPSEPTENVRTAASDRGESTARPERDRTEFPTERIQRTAALGAPIESGGSVASRVVEPAARRVEAPVPADPVSDFLGKRSSLRDEDRQDRDTSSGKFGERLHGLFGSHCEKFKSDHVFDGFISPVTNPFLFEDPRSLTEVRPIFMYQQVPSRQPDLTGGNIWYFGTQARLAFTNRWSMVFHKLGGISVNPSSGSAFDGQTGFAELWLGPKYTFVRNEDAGRVMAGGLQFQIPVGSSGTFQDTGSLSLVPYFSYAENFCRDWSIGSLNTMLSTGYAISVDNQRSDYYYLSAHLDLDVGNSHRFYPLTELNWIIYTSDATSRPIGSEGRDLINFGGQAKGNGMLTWAIGARYKFSESAQIGGAFELPIAGPRDLFSYRFTLDFILRY